MVVQRHRPSKAICSKSYRDLHASRPLKASFTERAVQVKHSFGLVLMTSCPQAREHCPTEGGIPPERQALLGLRVCREEHARRAPAHRRSSRAREFHALRLQPSPSSLQGCGRRGPRETSAEALPGGRLGSTGRAAGFAALRVANLWTRRPRARSRRARGPAGPVCAPPAEMEGIDGQSRR